MLWSLLKYSKNITATCTNIYCYKNKSGPVFWSCGTPYVILNVVVQAVLNPNSILALYKCKLHLGATYRVHRLFV